MAIGFSCGTNKVIPLLMGSNNMLKLVCDGNNSMLNDAPKIRRYWQKRGPIRDP